MKGEGLIGGMGGDDVGGRSPETGLKRDRAEEEVHSIEAECPATEERLRRFELDAPVVSHTHIIGSEFEIAFHAPDIAATARPGQFLELLFGDNYAPLVRRPFSLFRVDRIAGTCSVLYLARGSFTSGLAQKRVGDVVSLLGPLGRPFRPPQAPKTRHILVAGGFGAPPLYFLARELCIDRTGRNVEAGSITVVNAARTRELLVATIEFGALDIVIYTITDDGSHGRRGIATEMLSALLEEADAEGALSGVQLYGCGPMPMLRAVGEMAIARGLACQISVETSMPCGIGICNGCAVRVRNTAAPNGIAYARACWDGPVFEARDLVWDKP